MISVCIPIYNYPVYPLVRQLRNEIERQGLGAEFEIVCIDDHSSERYREENKDIRDIATYLTLENNIGRARIRNLFLEHTTGEWLLFLDNDSEVGEHFLEKYLKHAGGKADVVVGGRVYDRRGADPEHRLRYLYGKNVESRTAEQRREEPYRSFMTNNFMVRRRVLEQIGFDARLEGYGHEDTLFGYRLEEHRVPILHIDNPVVNGYVETNGEFLTKTVEGVASLAQIYGYMKEDWCFCRSVRLLRAYDRMRSLHLEGLYYRLFRWMRPVMEKRLKEGRRGLVRILNLYKLGVFIELFIK